MAETPAIAGMLDRRDVAALVNATRDGAVGPTALYYAGAVAPAISAAMALVTRSALAESGLLTPDWVMMWSSIVAAMAGGAWYLIFVRWSDAERIRERTARQVQMAVQARPDALVIRRGAVETRVAWAGVNRIERTGHRAVIHCDGAAAAVVPSAWFDSQGAWAQFLELVEARASAAAR